MFRPRIYPRRISSNVWRTHRLSTSSVRSAADDNGQLPTTNSPIVSKLNFFNSVGSGAIPTYRVMDGMGQLIEGAEMPEVRLHTFECDRHLQVG